MSREAAALADVFLLLFLLAVVNVGQRLPWEGQPLRVETTGVRTQSVDPNAIEVRVAQDGYHSDGVVYAKPGQFVEALDEGVAFVVLLGGADADYSRYEQLERALQSARIRYVRHAAGSKEVTP